VKEITKEEIGPVRIGLNRTEYKWNGRDEYGDALANGVYFYRVITNLDGKQMDHLSTTGTYSRLFNNSDFDKYFKKGFGKLVIMR
jgi:flagellar hook assembly protein FlgD